MLKDREAIGPCREYQGLRYPDGYGRFYVGGKYVVLHRWVLEQIHGPLPKHILALHKCDNPPCFLFDHLYPGTHQQNMDDKLRRGRQTHIGHKGEKNFKAKLTDKDVCAIRDAKGQMRAQDVAKQYGVNETSIYRIWRNAGWRHVDATD